MQQRWPVLFRQFSLSVDSVDEQTIERAQQVLEHFFVDRLGVSFFRAAVDGAWIKSGDYDMPALETVWSRWNKGLPTIPTREDGAISSQVALCYLTRKPLWIVAEDEGRLAEAERAGSAFVDLWSDLHEIPDYSDHGDSVARTAIMLPLEYGTRVFGVLDLQFDDVIPITDRGKLALRRVAASLARLIWLYENNETRNADTFRAFTELEEEHNANESPLRMRQVFFSCSQRADKEVVDVVLAVLAEFDKLFEVHYWREDALAGDIKQQVRDALMLSEFGVCYLSEPDEDEEGRFEDNPNVIFEAGMLQAMSETHHDRDDLSRWIPVREVEPFTDALPFNFATDRVIGVPRDPESGALVKEAFEESFRAAVTAQVKNLGLRP